LLCDSRPLWQLPFPGAAIVQFVIAGAAGKLAWGFGPSFVAAAKMGGALVKAILVRTAIPRHFVSVAHDARKQLGYLIQALLILVSVNLRHVGSAPCKMRFDYQRWTSFASRGPSRLLVPNALQNALTSLPSQFNIRAQLQKTTAF